MENKPHEESGLTLPASPNMPIPEATMQRKIGVQDACRLYIWMRMGPMHKIAKKTGVRLEHLARCRIDDKWDEFAAEHFLETHGQHGEILAKAQPRTDAEIIFIEDEVLKQKAVAVELQLQRRKILIEIRAFKKGERATVEYKRLIDVLKILTGQIEHCSGLERYMQEEAAKKDAALRLQEAVAKRSMLGDQTPDVPDGKTVEGPTYDVVPPDAMPQQAAS